MKDTFTIVNEPYKTSDVDEKCENKMKIVKICEKVVILILIGIGSVIGLICGWRFFKRKRTNQMQKLNI